MGDGGMWWGLPGATSTLRYRAWAIHVLDVAWDLVWPELHCIDSRRVNI